MSDDLTAIGPADEQDLRAAEYVVGSLPLAEARAIEAEAQTSPALSASIAAWEMRLLPLIDLVTPTPPPPILWRRLALATGIANDNEAAPPARPGLWRSPALWRTTTVASLAMAASLAFLLLARPPAAPEPLMAALSPYGGPGATFLIRVGADGVATVVAVGDTNVPAGRTLELWAVAGQAAPVSMGLLPESGRARLTIPVAPGTQLLVSQEPAGGSPTKAPTGPVVYAGKLTGI